MRQRTASTAVSERRSWRFLRAPGSAPSILRQTRASRASPVCTRAAAMTSGHRGPRCRSRTPRAGLGGRQKASGARARKASRSVRSAWLVAPVRPGRPASARRPGRDGSTGMLAIPRDMDDLGGDQKDRNEAHSGNRNAREVPAHGPPWEAVSIHQPTNLTTGPARCQRKTAEAVFQAAEVTEMPPQKRAAFVEASSMPRPVEQLGCVNEKCPDRGLLTQFQQRWIPLSGTSPLGAALPRWTSRVQVLSPTPEK